ncbi:MAG: hypothetical protein RO257_16370 [Candidatus Kapabacteria bacterium]|nr:hypothetical protein [Candidatus Kapabacteria bacterium]
MIDITNKDFTYFKYEKLLKVITEISIPVYTVIDWYEQKPEKGILIRHDIDRWADNALQIAELESRYNIKTTYYFRKTKGSFKPEIIRRIAELGHEIGYHYEDLSLASGNYEKAKFLFNNHLNRLRQISKVETCAMHGRPLSKIDNRDIWKKFNLDDFGLEAEALLSIDYTDTYYFTDTGRSWAENSANLRDKVNTDKVANISTTDELIDFINSNPNEKIALVVHTERWSQNFLGFQKSSISDGIVNFIKFILKKFR